MRTGTSWTQQAKLTASDAAAGDTFGHFVSTDGNHVIIGAPWKDSITGVAYIREVRELDIPNVYAAPGEPVTVPLDINRASLVAGADIEVSYDETVLAFSEVNLTTLSAGMNLVVNTTIPERVVLSIAHTAVSYTHLTLPTN